MEQATQDPDRRCQHCGTALSDETAAGLCPRCLLEMNFASRTMPGGEPSPQIPPPTPEEMAARFPQFEILECLGRGGMGIVYKARQKTLDRLVAIKVLAGERHDDPLFEARFEKEARTLAKLSHPNIVTVHDFGESDGMYYLVMEFVDGVNLRDVLRDGRMEPAQALAIVPEICAALQFAHDHGVVHRDIKPENILIDRDGRVKIADFGIAALIGSDADHSGTPPYMAPEQESAGGTIDHRADIYALGVVFYEMLTGERPQQDPSKPSHRVEIDVRLDEIVLRALEKEPARRYQTAGEFRTVVETIRAKAPKETRTEAAGLKDEINSSSPTPPRASTNSSMLPPNRGIVMVGRRGGKAVINWPGVALIFLMILAIVQAGGALFCLALRTPMTSMAMVMGLFGAIMATGIGLGRARSTPLERLVDLDKLHATQANDAAGPPPPPKPAGSHGPFRRLWWLFLVMPPACLLLGLIAGVLWGFLTPMQYEAKTVIEISTQATGSDHADVMALSSGDSEWITRLNATAVLDRVVGQLDLARSWSVNEAQARQTLVTLATFPAIPGTNLRELRIRHTDASQAAAIANAWAQALKAWCAEKDTGETISVVEEATTPERSFGEFSPRVIFGSAVAGLLLSPLIAILLIQTIHRGGRWLLRVVTITAGSTAVLAMLIFSVVSILRKVADNKASADAARLPVSVSAPENSPEHAARSFMEAIREGDMDAAMVWADPKVKQGKEFPLNLELVSKILRDEIYAGQLDRLTKFTERYDTNLDATTPTVTFRIAAPGGEGESYYPYGLALILVSTPDGWRVAHFDGSAPGDSLPDFTRAVTGGRSHSRPGIRQISLLDADAQQGPVVLDLASGELLEVPKEVQNQSDVTSHFNRLGKGDIAWDVGVIITLRSARVSEWLDGGWTLRNPEQELDNSGAYRITIPSRLRITTAEGGHYIVDVKEKIENEKGVRIEYQESHQPDKDGSGRDFEVPAIASHDAIERAKALPVTPPISMPSGSPITVETAIQMLQGVTWHRFLEAFADYSKAPVWSEVVPEGNTASRSFEVRFLMGGEEVLLDLAVDAKFSVAVPSNLRPARRPDKVITNASGFLPFMVIRCAMNSGHAPVAPAVDEVMAQAYQFRAYTTLKQYATELMVYLDDTGSFPPDLVTLRDGDFPGKKRWEGLKKDSLMQNHQTGKMERPIYHGYEDLRANDHDVARFILLAAPSADSKGKRFVAFIDGSVNLIDEQDYQKQVLKQAEAKAPGQAAIPNSGIRVVGRTASEWAINYTSDGKQSLSLWTGTKDSAVSLLIPEGSGTAKLKATQEGFILETGSQKAGPIPLEAFSFAEGNVIVEPDGSVIVGKCSGGVVGIRIAEVPPQAGKAVRPSKDIRISATPDGMWLDDRKVSHEELAEALKQLHPDTKILIQADPSLRHKEMAAIMETCRNAGLVHIAFASKTNPEKEPSDQ